VVMCKATVDMDALTAALNVLDILLRRIPSLRVALEELDFTEILENICENTPENVGEVAANLLDDFFEVQDDEQNDADMDLGHACFGFQGSPQTEVDYFHFGAPVEHQSAPSRASGMGRGRGAVLPSWMPKN
jgi:hypothetical protein